MLHDRFDTCCLSRRRSTVRRAAITYHNNAVQIRNYYFKGFDGNPPAFTCHTDIACIKAFSKVFLFGVSSILVRGLFEQKKTGKTIRKWIFSSL